MEMAYHDNNKRELEITRHVSLRQLDPQALLTFRITGSCTITIPEWLYDRDCPGHYMRRIKNVRLSIPSVVGPYTGVNCTLSLRSSSIRVSPLLTNGVYARDTTQTDARFLDNYGATDVIVTSSGSNDSGMFETNLRDERFLPFEGAGAISTWTLSLPQTFRTFDYSTISFVILHVRYTARRAGDPLGSAATTYLGLMLDGQVPSIPSSQALMFCLKYDFPTEWAAFVAGLGANPFKVTLEKQSFPYIAQSALRLTVDSVTLYAGTGDKVESSSPLPTSGLAAAGLAPINGPVSLSFPQDSVLTPNQSQLVFMVLQYHFGKN